METITYQGWPTCYRMRNDLIELIVTGDVGPRIIRCGFVDGENLFYEAPELRGQRGGEAWVNYGGHRLWHAPEAVPRTYAPDNTPITVEALDDGGTRFTQLVEPTTGIEKAMDIRLDADAPRVTVIHRLRNVNLWPVELAPWALSVMAAGGRAIVPLPPRGSHRDNLLPTGSIALWPYTDLRDQRWTWGTQYVLLQQNPDSEKPQKAGFNVPDGWVAYWLRGALFVKTFTPQTGATYPDLGSQVECFTNARMLEVETLGPMTRLEPGAAVEHVEQWHLVADIPEPETDADVDAYVVPHRVKSNDNVTEAVTVLSNDNVTERPTSFG